jgi:DHA1 family inner membrane transport protein
VVYVLPAGTFLMSTSEFVIAGILPQLAREFGISVADAGLAITTFAVSMIVGTPTMILLTLRLPRRLTLTLALAVFILGHVIVAISTSFEVLLAARFLTALATGAFWSVGLFVAAQAVGPSATARALGLVLGGGMLANVVGVPLGSFSGQVFGWRTTFWAIAVLALLVAVLFARLVPADRPGGEAPSMRKELAILRNGRLWLTLATCAMVTGAVLSIYSFISPVLTERAGQPETMLPLALMAFGLAAFVGTLIGGRLGDTHPFATPHVTAGLTLVAALGILVFSTEPVPLLVLFTLLGLVGLSSNAILIALAVRFGGEAPTLAAAMPTSIFNVGIALGTLITGRALESRLGALAPPVIGAVFAALIFVPLSTLTLLEHRSRRTLARPLPPDGLPLGDDAGPRGADEVSAGPGRARRREPKP